MHHPLLPALLQISVPSLWQYVQETGGSRSLYGVAAAVDSFCGIIFLPLYGYLADRYSPKVRLPRGTRSQPANRHHNHQTPCSHLVVCCRRFARISRLHVVAKPDLDRPSRLMCVGTQTIFLVSFVIMATGGVIYGAAAVRNPTATCQHCQHCQPGCQPA